VNRLELEVHRAGLDRDAQRVFTPIAEFVLDNCKQENIRLREALQKVYDAFWQAKLEVRYPHANKLAEDMLYTASPEIV